MIYLDHHAATPLAEAAMAAMKEAGPLAWANPASVHRAGRAARALLERARDQVAEAIGGRPAEIVFTSGGTEACAQGVLGLAGTLAPGCKVVTTGIEHPAVAAQLAQLAGLGVQVQPLPVRCGRPPSQAELAAVLTRDTALVAIQWVNHETGTLMPVSEYGQVCAAAGVPFFVDGTQALGKVPVQVADSGITALALAAHKLGGPSGAGALWVRRGHELASLLRGGGQERGRRAGTPDVLNLVGFGAACAEVSERLRRQPDVAALRDRLEARLGQWVGPAGGMQVNGYGGPRVGTVTNLSVPGCRGADLVVALDVEGVCAASGAACSSGLSEPSPVLRAMYPDDPGRATSALRLSFGLETLEDDEEIIATKVLDVCSRVARAGG